MALFFFVRRLFSVVYLMTHPAVPMRLKVLPVIAVAYFLSPRDLIPDFVPFIGRLDDLIVIAVLLGIFTTRGWQHVLRAQRGKNDAISVDFEVLSRVDQQAGTGREDASWEPADAPEDDRPPTADLRS